MRPQHRALLFGSCRQAVNACRELGSVQPGHFQFFGGIGKSPASSFLAQVKMYQSRNIHTEFVKTLLQALLQIDPENKEAAEGLRKYNDADNAAKK